MTAALIPLYVEQGVTKRFTLTVEYETAPESGVWLPYDLSGCTARMQIRNKPKGILYLEVTTETADEIVIDLPLAGHIQVHLPDEKTDALTKRALLYDLEVEFPSGDVKRVVEGPVIVSLQITEELT